VIIPVADRHLEYAQQLEAELQDERVRARVDARSETVNLKIRQAQLDKIPYMLVVGDKEVADNKVSLRLRSGEKSSQTWDRFKENVRLVINSRARDLSL
jgi:threonyl-tRNA synthetase